MFTDVFIEATVYSDYLKGGGNSTDRLLLNPEILVSEAIRNSLRDLKIENFCGGACPQTLLL